MDLPDMSAAAPLRKTRVVNRSSGAIVGDAVDVRILVGVALGRGVIEAVGDWVLVGICVVVLLGEAVFERGVKRLTDCNQPATNRPLITEYNLMFLL
jgi:hypothetical protein